MRTITKEYKLYTVDELDNKAKERAYNDWLSDFEDFDFSDNENTLEAFLNVFDGIKVSGWSYDMYNHYFNMSSNYNEDIERLSGERLLRYLYNNFYYDLFKPKAIFSQNKMRHSRILKDNCCVLTGFCRDEDILEPVYTFLSHPDKNTSFIELMHDCIDSFFNACSKDYEYYSSMEGFENECETNDWEFLENGKLFS